MSLAKVLKGLREKNNKRNIRLVDSAKIYAEENGVFLEVNGNPFSIDIHYKGGAEIRSHLGAYFRITYKSNRIRIINLFNRKPPLRMFSYIGNLNIIRCQIMSYDGTFLKANITRNNELLKIQNQKTKVEDDTLIIREGVESEQIFPIKTGLKKIPKGRILRKSNVVERIDINQILTSITKPGKIRTDIETQPRARETVPVEKAVRKELRTKTSTKDSKIKGGGY